MNLYRNKTYIKDLDKAISMCGEVNTLCNKSVLITGATGTIGSFIADMLLRLNETNNSNITLYVAGRNVEKLSARYLKYHENMVKCLYYDLNDKINFGVQADYIIHAAGNAHPKAFNNDPVGTIMGNITGTHNLLEYGLKHGTKRFLYISSGEVYGKDVQPDLNDFKENFSGYIDITSPRSCYPLSKRTAENLCISYSSQFNLETVIARPCHTYGPEITSSDNRAHAQFIRDVLNNEDIIIKSEGKQLRSYNYIADCASAILTVLLKGQTGEAYNIASSTPPITIAKLAETVAKIKGKKVIFNNSQLEDLVIQSPIEKQVLNIEKLESLGWKGCFSIDEGLKHTLDILQFQ